MRRLLLLFLPLLLLVPALGHDAPGSDPPRYPAAPPPPLAPAPASSPAGKVWKYSLQPGWNMLSFPVDRVTRLQGLSYQLLRPSSGGPVPIDPIAHPEQVDTGRGYWAYADRPTTLEVSGPPKAKDDPGIIILEPGWNLIGCPSAQPVDLRNVGLGAAGTGAMTVEQAVDVEPCLIFGYAYLHPCQSAACTNATRGKFELLNLDDPQSQLEPQQAAWVYARTPTQINLNVGQTPPRLTSVTREPDGVVVRGSGLGTLANGRVYFAEHQVPTSRVTSWTDSEIRAPGPAHAVNGTLVVLVNGRPSNRLPVQLGDPIAPVPGGLTGQVTDDSNQFVPGARIQIDTGQSTRSDESGGFSFSGLPPGPHAMQASHPGYGGAQGNVTVLAGKNKPVAIMLPLRRGAISVRAYPYPYGSANFQPTQILMWETGDYSHRYRRDYSSYERGWTRYDLNWGQLPLGREYSVTVTWQDAAGNEQTITHRDTLDRTDFVDTFYNSWSY